MLDWKTHLIVAPIVLPLVTAAVLLLFDERKRKLKMAINSISTLGLIVIAVALAGMASEKAPDALVYLIGNWPAPFGIVLVLDRLAALMLVLTSLLGMASLSFALAHWHKASPHFHTIFQLLLMGLNGAFLTGDLFNLFVFFEVMLAASYGLALHGSGPARVKAGMHYIAVNLVASSLFLIGVSLIYGVTGTLNMADLAQKISQVAPEDRMLLEAGAAVLGVAFLVKAGMWPLNFWLAPTYTAAAAPVAAVFAIMSKVGIYVLLRLSPLMFGIGAGSSYGFGNDWLYFGGMVTLAFGLIGVVASQAMGRLASYSILVSSGTLLAAIGSGNTAMTGAALFYMISSTLTIAAFFLLIELIERGQDAAANVVLLSGLSALIAMTRTGIRTFWASLEGNVPRVLVREVVPIAGLLAICLALTIAAGPAMRYMDETARALHNPASYISSVLNAPRAGIQKEGAQ